MTSSGSPDTTRPPMGRRRSGEVPVRTRSSTNMESITHRIRKKSLTSMKNMGAPADGGERSAGKPTNSESHWESSSDDDTAEGLQLEMHAKEPAHDAQTSRKHPPTSLPLNDATKPSSTHTAAPYVDDAPSPRTVVPPQGTAPQSHSHMVTPRKCTPKLESGPMVSGSPRSLRSSSSVRSIHSLLAGHAGGPSAHAAVTTTPVGPVLNTTPVVGGHHGTHGFSLGPDTSGEYEVQERPLLRPTSSTTGLQRPQPSAVSTAWSSAPALQRTWSLQSFQPTHTGETHGMTSSASRDQLAHLLVGHARRGTVHDAALMRGGVHALPAGRRTSASFATLLGSTRATERAAKPIVSKFAHAQQQFDAQATQTWVLPSSDEMPGRVVSVDVPPNSVYSAAFAERVVSRMGRPPPLDDPARVPSSPSPSPSPSPLPYRYLLDFGLSGPPIDRAALGPAALTPRRGVDLPSSDDAATTRASAAAPRNKMLVPDSTTTLGPNMIPFHFIHALTSTVEQALAMDPAEVPAMASLLPGAAERLDEGEGLSDGAASGSLTPSEGPLHWIDHASMRAIGCTAQAVALQRLHTVTRRFADPFRWALARVARQAGTAPQAPVEPSRLPRNVANDA
ncbi:hypothetical protein MNAN1_002515 [Malassezia nana]|uniref:Uncharacterized protein n=1 Tax=Malassezia nana TaxID=180528 RepID=A0AAF0J428_9BASI|nr:hypothetical protein MNAN1_002515 [Malassezia nana]